MSETETRYVPRLQRRYAEAIRPADAFQNIQHLPPALHAAPANLAFRRQPLAMRFGRSAGTAEGLDDEAGVARRIGVPCGDARG